MKLERTDIDHMDQRFRAQFVNGLSGFKSANLVGTADGRGATNLSIVSSVVHLGANPPLLAFISRPHSAPRHTLENILETRCYTFNHVHSDIVQSSHQTSARYDRDVAEFEACGLTAQWRQDFAAPLVAESRIKMGLHYIEHHTLLNQTVMVIGELAFVELPDEAVRADGSLDIAIAGTVAAGGLDAYHTVNPPLRLSYAKPDKTPESI